VCLGICDMPGAAEGIQQEAANGHIPSLRRGSDSRRFLRGTPKQHRGSRACGALCEFRIDQPLQLAVLMEQFFIHRRVPLGDIQHLSTDPPALKCGALADGRTSDEERGAVAHDSAISSGGRSFNPQLEVRNVFRETSGIQRCTALENHQYCRGQRILTPPPVRPKFIPNKSGNRTLRPPGRFPLWRASCR